MPASATTGRDEMRAHAHKRKVIELASSLSGLAMGVDGIEINRALAVMEPAEREEWIRSLGDSLRRLNRFRNDLKEA